MSLACPRNLKGPCKRLDLGKPKTSKPVPKRAERALEGQNESPLLGPVSD
jgi:hypothetical protein